MNEPQVWTLIGVFSSTMVGVMVFLSQSVTRSISAVQTVLAGEIRSLREETRTDIRSLRHETAIRFEKTDAAIDSLREETGTKIDSLREETSTKIDSLRSETNARFESVSNELTHLNRDIQALTRHVFPEQL